MIKTLFDIPRYYLKINRFIGLVDLLGTVIAPAVQHTNEVLRQLGVKCLGLYCMLK
jgi:hypothetical protein